MKTINIAVLSLMTWSVLAFPAWAKNDCSAVAIDNDTSDWTDIDPLLSDDQDLTGTDYYYNGSTWSETSSDDDIYSTNIIAMQDLQTIKACNSATQLQLYIDAYHPLLAYKDIASGSYYEFGDPNGPDGELGLPADLDFWLVFKMQEVDSDIIYYYVVYLYAETGDLGLENGPRQIAIYQESNEVAFAEAIFNPDEDDLVIEIEGSDSKAVSQIFGEGGKNIDASGGFESGPMLMNAAGEGLFNMTDIVYGDELTMVVETYDGSFFSSTKAQAVSVVESRNDYTDDTSFHIRRQGVVGVKVPQAYRADDQVRVKWDAVDDANTYQVRLYASDGHIIKTITANKTQTTLKNLDPNNKYRVKVRAKIGALYTPWSDKTAFSTKSEQ